MDAAELRSLRATSREDISCHGYISEYMAPDDTVSWFGKANEEVTRQWKS